MALDYAEGDTFYAADVDNIIEAAEKNGVLTGWAVVENGTPNMSVNVQLGTGFAGGTYNTTVGDTNVVITASHASLNRIDLIVVNNSGTFSAVAGTPAATPNPADLPDNSIILASVYVGATVTTILNANITQKGILLGTIKEQMLDTNVAFLNNAETVSGNWKHSGTVNFQNDNKYESGKKIQFCVSGDTVVGSIYGDATQGMRAGSGMIFGAGYKISFGDGIDYQGFIHGTSTGVRLEIEDTTTGRFKLFGTNETSAGMEIECTGGLGGIVPSANEAGGVGATGEHWRSVTGWQVGYGAGGIGAYSSQEDLEDLRAIKEYRDENGNPLRTTEHGDPVWDTRTIPAYLRNKQDQVFRSKRQKIKRDDKYKDKKFGVSPVEIIEAAPEMAYMDVSSVQGWFISILKKLDEEIQEIKAALHE